MRYWEQNKEWKRNLPLQCTTSGGSVSNDRAEFTELVVKIFRSKRFISWNISIYTLNRAISASLTAQLHEVTTIRTKNKFQISQNNKIPINRVSLRVEMVSKLSVHRDLAILYIAIYIQWWWMCVFKNKKIEMIFLLSNISPSQRCRCARLNKKSKNNNFRFN